MTVASAAAERATAAMDGVALPASCPCQRRCSSAAESDGGAENYVGVCGNRGRTPNKLLAIASSLLSETAVSSQSA
jgi:hypothetical protein